MLYGLYVPNLGEQVSARALAQLAREAEEAGWDGMFLWDHILYKSPQSPPVIDPWIALAAMAMVTKRIRLGTAVTPIARRHPWKLARETVTLDHLCDGRLTLGVGLGQPARTEFAQFGDESDQRTRAARLDEGLEVLTGLWSGQPFSFKGEYYRVHRTTFLPTPLQSPRIPIWVAGIWPRPKPFQRAAKWDGVVPLRHGGAMSPQDIRDMRVAMERVQPLPEHFDIVKIHSVGTKDRERNEQEAACFAEVGVTWWLDSLFPARNSLDALREHIAQGPARVE
jgi:alkanesulfonate monooxygenase SsuD/methylene tetrahydromethanopterin reductase-like flavin-dependent oxidoreductase (luciferase family)